MMDLICKEMNNLAAIERGAMMLPVEDTFVAVQPPQQLANTPEEGLLVAVNERSVTIPDGSHNRVENKEGKEELSDEITVDLPQ
jgi:hypothetical protein